jgi:hypothetical protein
MISQTTITLLVYDDDDDDDISWCGDVCFIALAVSLSLFVAVRET